ncbi:alkaline phosphatase family protein [Ramlibacter albus]|uniref:Alkaline phosphatase family protein n=1 Tax=Ramlibacter albus TaxID=2079448 RepID=A0A923S833_9BURK|nr:alkaline phosphatase family protein [Ramlibacter albus]MBC5767707.1 alkaline phosphatase family protein [Ramlibacter albus]
MKQARCTFLAASLVVLLAGCAGMAPSASAPPPKLVVFMAVDGLPQRQVLAYRDQLAPDGFARFLDRGAWFADAHYAHSFTVTAAGHATMLTGAYPHRTGIIGNEWKDQATGADVYNTGDTSCQYIGNRTRPLDGTSPRNLKVETVGDVLRRVSPQSKVIGISGKDRGAILPAGKTGTAYMYMGETGQFASTTCYMPRHPAWVDAFNAAKPADRWFKQEWKPVLAEEAYARSLPDAQPWFGRKGAKLPMMMGAASDDKPGPAYYTGLLPSPFEDMLSLEFARAAIAGEQLGRDDAPDILSVSLSGHDYINHAYSAESRLSHDHFLHLDRMLQAFFRDLDATVGPDNYMVVLTADHGFMPAPEVSQQQGRDAGRIDFRRALANINQGLATQFGVPGLVMNYSSATLLLNKKLIAEKNLSLDAVADAARKLLLAEPGFDTAYTRAELLSGSRRGDRFFDAQRKAWHPDVSGEVQFSLKPYWMFASSSAATHGSPHPYDTNVPILVYGPKWVKPGRIDMRVEVADIAPTLAGLLHVPPPSTAEGKPLPLIRP